MASPEEKASKKRRQEGDPADASKRKQKKQKKDPMSTELVREPSPEHGGDPGNGRLKAEGDPAATESSKPKKDKKKKKPKTEDPLPTKTNATGEDAPTVSEDSPEKSRKSKKSKKDRPAPDTLTSAPDADRLTPPPTADEAKPRKSKKRDVGSSRISPEAVPETNGVHQGDTDASPAKTKKSSKKKRKENENQEAAVLHPVSNGTPEATPKKQKDRLREIQATLPPSQPHSSQRLDSDFPSAKRTAKLNTSKPSAPPPPIVMQEVARWVPLWPRGWHQPITAAIEQHLTPKLNRYDGDMGGVLLGYKNVCLNDRPSRKGAATQDSEAVKLLSVNEFAVGFCWLIADLELFLPKRGSWMEGDLILQNQGHIGVVCWDKFNASIEASRLPPKWSWVAAPEDGLANEDVNMDLDGNQGATPLGYWVDENGDKVEGKLRFRIKNYDVGLSGDHSFLCIEGTMLDETQENSLREKELKLAAGAKGSAKRRPQRVLPEFSMTDLGLDEEAERDKRWRKVPSSEEQAPGESVEEEAGQGVEEAVEEESAEETEAMDMMGEED
ncbi:hypothetical protein VUR80DRAFT_9892 [Thermomyces stellatus]